MITVRTDQPTPDAVSALWKDGYADRLDVRPLSESETRMLIEAVLGGPMDRASAHRLWKLTAGTALFLRHLVNGELDSGRLRQTQGVWRCSGVPDISPVLSDLIEARMGALPEAVRRVVDLLAVAEPLEVDLLSRLVDQKAIEEAEVCGVVAVVHDGTGLQARLAHPLYGEVRRCRVGTVQARRLRGLVASELGNQGEQTPERILRRAVLTLDSDIAPDQQMLIAGARSALGLSDLALCERLAHRAADAGAGFDPGLLLAYSLSWAGRGADADVELRSLADLAGSDQQRAQVAVPSAGNQFWNLGQPDEAEAVLEVADSIITDDAARNVLTAMRATFHASLGRPRLAVERAREALASDGLPSQAVLYATWGLVGGLGDLGRTDQVTAAAERGYAATGSFDSTLLRTSLAHVHVTTLQLAGYLDEAEHIADWSRAATRDCPGLPQFHACIVLGRLALGRGRLRTALRTVREARADMGIYAIMGFDYQCLLVSTKALAMAGDTSAAQRSLAETLAARHPAFAYLDPELVLAKAWVAASEGMSSDSIAFAHEAAELAGRRGQLAFEVLALHTAVRFGDTTNAGRLAELASQVDGPRAPAAAIHSAALASGDGKGLRIASHRLEQLGDLLAAADAAAHAAIAYSRCGQRGSALAAGSRAHKLATVCEGAHTPALGAAQAAPLPLTDRQREIATLAAKGLSNKQIADRLVMSIRTVEGHLYRVGVKLGTTNRTELADVIKGG